MLRKKKKKKLDKPSRIEINFEAFGYKKSLGQETWRRVYVIGLAHV